MMRRLVFGVSVLFLISIPSVWAEPDADIRMFDARVLSNSFVSAIEKVSPAVVSINGERKFNSEDRERINGIIQELPESFRDMLDLIPDRQRWQGSGMMIRADGLILTNYHVLEGAEKLSAQFADGREFRGEIAGHDPYTDIALLQLENCPGDLPTVSLGDSDTLRVGEWVLAIGSPFRLFGSVSEGIVSAKNRTGEDVPLDNENRLFMYKDFIQTTAAINIGNSGGPL
ncbi:MAG TPA: trypsin-like peptidase domain-containing protein, partial [bacterium]|nr:trypsin-like peptidase domain-containing protein [bacterium]